MRYLQKVWKWLFGIIVVLIFCLPVVFLLAGSLKGTKLEFPQNVISK